MDRERYRGLLDMLDGGGAGRSGQTFEGGLFSGLLNALGIRPMGYAARLEDARPQPRPQGLVPPPPQPAPPIQTQPLIGSLSPDDILAAINSGRLPAGPPTRPAAPTPAPTALPTFADLLEMDRRRRGGQAVMGFEIGRAFPPTYR